MQAAEQADACATLDAAEDRPQVVGPQGRRIQIANQIDGMLLFQRLGQIHRPGATLGGVDQFVVHLQLGDRRQRATQPGLLESRRALEVQDTQAAFDDFHERRELVVGDDDLTLEPVHDERQLALAYGLRCPGKSHRLLAAAGTGLDGRPRNLLHRAGVIFDEQSNRGTASGQALELDATRDLQRVLHRHAVDLRKLDDRRIPPLPRPALLPEGHGPERRPHVAQTPGGRLRGRVPRCMGLLRPVAEQDHARERPSGQGPQAVFEGGPDRRLVGGGGIGPVAEREGIVPDGRQRMKLPIECPDRDIDPSGGDESFRHRPRRGERLGHFAPPGPSAGSIGHVHALGCIGEHEHGSLLPGLRRGHERGPHQAQDDRQEGGQTQGHEREHLTPRDPGPIRRHGQ